jgi:hypothetical protein
VTAAGAVIAALGLQPLQPEGGYFRETYRSARSTAIYYLITRDSFSRMHRLTGDEVFHFYRGDPVEQLHLRPDGSGEWITLGTELHAGQRPQVVVPGGTWQGARLTAGGQFALLGTTMAPPFDPAGFETGDREALCRHWPAFADAIRALTAG